ncbi:MAG TPA: hypothetical protein VEV16_07920 [Daejeonella sp.]|nr:hypothetical protein [Daejeonella sp.]
MKSIDRFLLSSFFVYFSLCLFFFCAISVIVLDVRNPFSMFSMFCGIILFVLMQRRKWLLKKSSKA